MVMLGLGSEGLWRWSDRIRVIFAITISDLKGAGVHSLIKETNLTDRGAKAPREAVSLSTVEIDSVHDSMLRPTGDRNNCVLAIVRT